VACTSPLLFFKKKNSFTVSLLVKIFTNKKISFLFKYVSMLNSLIAVGGGGGGRRIRRTTTSIIIKRKKNNITKNKPGDVVVGGEQSR